MSKNITGAQAGTIQSNQVNNPNVDHMRGRNYFPQTFRHPSTCRYGEVDPVMTFKCERGDIVPYKFDTDLNTLTMASPLKSEVDMYTAAFKVPMEAIYPRNWDIMQPIPNKGDDVPDDTRALFSPLNYGYVLSNGIVAALNNSELYQYAIRNVFLTELVFSAGSVFAKCNYHFNGFRFPVLVGGAMKEGPVTFDKYFDNYFAPWFNGFLQSSDGEVIISHYDGETPDYKVTTNYSLVGTKFANNGYFITLRRAYELMRTGEYTIEFDTDDFFDSFPRWAFSGQGQSFNIEPIISYKCACSHFFTNPKIDFVYSWELFRDAQQSLVYGEDGVIPTFVWNGINKQYDVFSQKVMSDAMLLIPTNSNYWGFSSYWFNLFSFSRSLRYGDYFTGVHPEPLAVGDVNAPVVDSSVDAINMVEKIQVARLLNKVNIAGPRKDDQLVALYGGPLPEAPKDVPIRLSLEKFNVEGFETNNTGDLQASAITGEDATNITTTNLRLTESKYMFEVSIDEPCWIVVVQYFEAHRIYSNTLDRFAFHRDRMDDFQPDLQFIGDQEVFTQELDCVHGTEVAFAYNLRNMEYKQRYSYASGGFIDYLPSWLFITDNNDGNPPMPNITPEYIRSSPSEFDRFYKSLLGWSLASYFHFITTNTNIIAPYRQMIYAPEILA